MHKGVILLTKATDSDDALSNVEIFLEYYGNGQVWDWYVIGGRWSGSLNESASKFEELAHEHMKNLYPDKGYVSVQMIEEQTNELQAIWESLGNTSRNLWCRNRYQTKTDDDNIVPLSDCIQSVNEWVVDMNELAEQFWSKAVEMRADNKMGMSGYYARLYNECINDFFSFESNVYDIENGTNNPEKALENPNEWFAVMVDMHN